MRISFHHGALTGSRGRIAVMLLASAAAVAACSSDNNTTTPGTAATIAVVSGSVQTAGVGAAVSSPLIVQVKDQNGNPLSGATVTFTASGGGTLNQTTATTDASGNAATNLTLGTRSGADTVFAAVNGVSTNAIFLFTANPGPAAQIVQVSGNNQTGAAGAILGEPLMVQVQDSYGNPVSSATVLWTTTAGEISGNAQTVSDTHGDASAGFMLPATAGAATITATVQGTPISTSFTATAT